MAEVLPIYQFKGKQYFRDDRLHEYRNINNPNDRITYDDVFYGRAKFQKPTIPYPEYLLHSKPRKLGLISTIKARKRK